ncbi:MAG: helix-turn-helix transcriptional regulator [Bacilli bacterium]|nr:helix-turn-helix transcriptional regulator [Bacilli bacterium]
MDNILGNILHIGNGEMTVGEKITELRVKNNVTQEELASYLGLSRQSISKWETNRSLPSITYLLPITEYFDVTLNELFGVK